MTYFLPLGHQYFHLNRGFWVRGSLKSARPSLCRRKLALAAENLSTARPFPGERTALYLDKTSHDMSVCIERAYLEWEEASKLKMHTPLWKMGGRERALVALRGLEIRMIRFCQVLSVFCGFFGLLTLYSLG